ncbi:MAG TPA: MATE family efflux transporter [Thermoanaerobaculia bacterium]|nr:MATE family efflux transporter [Thermoanaerobaculia bacterium]
MSASPPSLDAQAAIAALPPRLRPLLEGPVAPTLLRLAAPNILVMLLQAAFTTLDAVFVGWIGSHALAGVSLVFPLVMLMQTMSAGGMGGGVSSAIARALGAGRRADADALVAHAVYIALAMAACFSATMLLAGPAIYRAMGGRGETLASALTYSHVIFAAAAIYWLFNTFASAIRGSGNMAVPAAVMCANALIYIALAPALVLGLGPLPRLGIAGAAAASVIAFSFGVLVLGGYLISGRGLVRLTFPLGRLRGSLLREILRVGAPGSVNTVFTNLTVVMLTGLVGPLGASSLAGYGLGARLEYLQLPLVFGLGTALVTMVGANAGAGLTQRAERVAWVGSAMAGSLTGSLGVFAAIWPRAWLGLFTTDADVIAAGTRYLSTVGPVYVFFGLGLALYFACQGAGDLRWPLLVGLARFLVAVLGGWLAIHVLGGGLAGLCSAITVSFVVYGLGMAAAFRAGAWRRAA